VSVTQWSRALLALRHAVGTLGLLLVSLLALLLVQLVLLLNRLAQGLAALARPLGFGWRGLSSAATAALLRNAVALAVVSTGGFKLDSHCAVLCCTALYCTLLYCTVLYCTVMYCTIL